MVALGPQDHGRVLPKKIGQTNDDDDDALG